MATKRAKREVKNDRAPSKQSTVSKGSARRTSQSTSVSKPASRQRAAVEARDGKTTKARGIVKRAAASVGRVLSKVTGRGTPAVTKGAKRTKEASVERVAKRQADIPMDVIAETYTPTQTSLKGPFRTSGADRQKDQEFAGGVADDRWNDEDRMTNKSGDPRIGTHGRSYEPGEARAASGRNRNR